MHLMTPLSRATGAADFCLVQDDLSRPVWCLIPGQQYHGMWLKLGLRDCSSAALGWQSTLDHPGRPNLIVRVLKRPEGQRGTD